MKKGLFRRLFKGLLLIVGLFLFVLLLFLVFNLVHPRLGWLKDKNPSQTSFQKYRMKQWKAQGKSRSVRCAWRRLPRISPYLQQAVVIAEDDKFWQHNGFDWEAMGEAMEKNWEKKTLRYGGSTISQQLVKNLFLGPSRTLVRKLREAVLTWRLEKTLTKKRMLEIYLNVVEWGEGIFGAEAAAGHYFSKSAADLSPAEAARLAAILPMPRRYTRRSFLSSNYLDRRVAEILTVMKKRGLVLDEPETQESAEGLSEQRQLPRYIQPLRLR